MKTESGEGYYAMRERVYGHESQEIQDYPADSGQVLILPPPRSPAFDDVEWGFVQEWSTVAFWAAQAWWRRREPWWNEPTLRLGETLAEEIVACQLCGYGVSGELGVAMFERLKTLGLANGTPSEERVYKALNAPVTLGARQARYRFPRQKARYIALGLAQLAEDSPPAELLALRDYLRGLPGIGWKTASFIARNLGSDEVAILDVHLVRGCISAGVFPEGSDPARGYADLERRFLSFARAIGARPSRLDALMWEQLRIVSRPRRAAAS